MEQLDNVKINFDSSELWLLNIALAIVMFGVALGISVDDFKSVFKQPKLVLVGVLSQFILLPFVTFLVIILVKPQASIALGMMMVAACPGGNISNFMTHLSKGNTALSVCLTALGTLLTVVLTPLNFQLYAGLYEPTAHILKQVELQPYDLFKLIIIILGVPLFLGMLLRQHYEVLALKLSKFLKPVSIVIFVAIVVIAFSKNLDIFYDYIHFVLILGICHNALAILLGLFTAKAFKLSFRDQKTIAIETGIQNSGLGLLLIFTFFSDLGGMAVMAAFWGIWHIVSGLLLSLYWSKYSFKNTEI